MNNGTTGPEILVESDNDKISMGPKTNGMGKLSSGEHGWTIARRANPLHETSHPKWSTCLLVPLTVNLLDVSKILGDKTTILANEELLVSVGASEKPRQQMEKKRRVPVKPIPRFRDHQRTRKKLMDGFVDPSAAINDLVTQFDELDGAQTNKEPVPGSLPDEINFQKKNKRIPSDIGWSKHDFDWAEPNSHKTHKKRQASGSSSEEKQRMGQKTFVSEEEGVPALKYQNIGSPPGTDRTAKLLHLKQRMEKNNVNSLPKAPGSTVMKGKSDAKPEILAMYKGSSLNLPAPREICPLDTFKRSSSGRIVKPKVIFEPPVRVIKKRVKKQVVEEREPEVIDISEDDDPLQAKSVVLHDEVPPLKKPLSVPPQKASSNFIVESRNRHQSIEDRLKPTIPELITGQDAGEVKTISREEPKEKMIPTPEPSEIGESNTVATSSKSPTPTKSPPPTLVSDTANKVETGALAKASIQSNAPAPSENNVNTNKVEVCTLAEASIQFNTLPPSEDNVKTIMVEIDTLPKTSIQSNTLPLSESVDKKTINLAGSVPKPTLDSLVDATLIKVETQINEEITLPLASPSVTEDHMNKTSKVTNASVARKPGSPLCPKSNKTFIQITSDPETTKLLLPDISVPNLTPPKAEPKQSNKKSSPGSGYSLPRPEIRLVSVVPEKPKTEQDESLSLVPYRAPSPERRTVSLPPPNPELAEAVRLGIPTDPNQTAPENPRPSFPPTILVDQPLVEGFFYMVALEGYPLRLMRFNGTSFDPVGFNEYTAMRNDLIRGAEVQENLNEVLDIDDESAGNTKSN